MRRQPKGRSPIRTQCPPSLLHRFAHDASGNVALLLGLCMVPMIGIVGLGTDYYVAQSHKARLDAAADAAAIAAITTAQTYINNNSSIGDPPLTPNAIAAGQAQAPKVFKVNAGNTGTLLGVTPQVVMTRTGQSLTATVTYTAQDPASFGKLFGKSSYALAGTAAASLTMGSYIDFYLALDVSGSMGLPTSDAGQTALRQVNNDDASSYPGGCQFACHFSGYTGYQQAVKYGIKLRVDSVGTAVTHLIASATNTQTLKNQYRIGVYPFIQYPMQAAAMSTNFNQATQVASQLGSTYLDTGMNNWGTRSMGSGGTHFENLLPTLMNWTPSTFGNGADALHPKAFIFIVTDGADNAQTYNGSSFQGGSTPQRPINFGSCQSMQKRGATIAILYLPYVPIQNPNPSFANDEDDVVNKVIPNIPGDLQACATPGYFFSAVTDADIDAALQKMFAQAVQAARLTR